MRQNKMKEREKKSFMTQNKHILKTYESSFKKHLACYASCNYHTIVRCNNCNFFKSENQK